jgi:hypothetical protein
MSSAPQPENLTQLSPRRSCAPFAHRLKSKLSDEWSLARARVTLSHSRLTKVLRKRWI